MESNISTQIALFSSWTIFYYVIRYKLNNPLFTTVLTLIYFLGIIIGMFGLNMAMTKEVCGTTQTGTAIMITSVPWLTIFGIMMIMIRIFPGWLMPFSNTFGYLIVKIANIEKVMGDIIAPKASTDNSIESKQTAYAIEQIYSNKSLIINELSEANFENFWNRTKNAGLLTSNAEESKDKLFNLIRLKNIVSEIIWSLLSGILAIAISNNYVADTACVRSTKEMIERMNQYEEEQKAEEKTPPKIYTN